MSGFGESPEHVERIDAALAQWRQGDLALEEDWFIHFGDAAHPLTDECAQSSEDGELVVLDCVVDGLVVVTQTCDLVRTCLDRPFVQVAPLVEVDDNALKQIERGYQPRYLYIPAAADRLLVADLDRVMTVEKSIVATWECTPGWTHDDESRRIAEALARKRSRPAFPDDFVRLVGKLQKRLRDKHDKQSPEGEALRALREIRVRAAPSWDADNVEVFFVFIEDDALSDTQAAALLKHHEKWLGLVSPAGRFVQVDGAVMGLDDMSARDYIESDRLDLDYLSSREST